MRLFRSGLFMFWSPQGKILFHPWTKVGVTLKRVKTLYGGLVIIVLGKLGVYIPLKNLTQTELLKTL